MLYRGGRGLKRVRPEKYEKSHKPNIVEKHRCTRHLRRRFEGAELDACPNAPFPGLTNMTVEFPKSINTNGIVAKKQEII